MKCLILLIACLAAANAATYHCRSYNYWCARSFNVYPVRRSYSYKITTPKCSYSFLTSYPKAKCGSEKSVRSITRPISRRLTRSYRSIRAQLRRQRTKFVRKINRIQATYTRVRYRYVCRRYGRRSCYVRRTRTKYRANLRRFKRRAIASFTKSMNRVLASVRRYQKSILRRVTRCLNTRRRNIRKFNRSLSKRIARMRSRYSRHLNKIYSRRMKFLRKSSFKLYGRNWCRRYQIGSFSIYGRRVRQGIAKYKSRYNRNLKTYAARLRKSYRCNYRCFFGSGCRRFYRRRYRNKCKVVRMPKCKAYRYKMYSIGKFRVSWRGCSYRRFKKCNLKKITRKFNTRCLYNSINRQVRKYQKMVTRKNAQWRRQVKSWYSRSRRALFRRIVRRIVYIKKRSHCGRIVWQRRYVKVRSCYRRHATKWLKRTRARLYKSISRIVSRTRKFITRFRTRSRRFVRKVAARHSRCLSRRSRKIKAYRKRLISLRNRRRRCLSSRLNKSARKYLRRYRKYMKNTFGYDLLCDRWVIRLNRAYRRSVNRKVSNIISRFNSYWRRNLNRLTRHYSCGYRCRTRASHPKLKVSLKWKLSAPSTRTCRFRRFY